MPDSPELQNDESLLRQQLEKLDELIALGADLHRQRAEVESELRQIKAAMSDSPGAMQAAGENTVQIRQVLDALNRRSGTLVTDNPLRYRFPHRSYQGYLAACNLSEPESPNLRTNS